MKPPGLFLLWICAIAGLAGMPNAGALAQDAAPITRVVPVNAPSAAPTPFPETPLPPIGSGPDTDPTPPPAISTAQPAPASQPPIPPSPAMEQDADIPPQDNGATQAATPARNDTALPPLAPKPSTPAPSAPTPAAPEQPPLPAYSIEIDLGTQRAYLLHEGREIAESPISSGRPDHLTATGNFEVIQKDLNHFSNLYGMIVDASTGKVVKAGADSAMPVPKGCKFVPAAMKWFMRFDGAAGMHAGILPGYAASHGCIRMPASKAELFYNTVDVGTPVHVFGTAPPPDFSRERPSRPTATPAHTPAPKRRHGWWIF